MSGINPISNFFSKTLGAISKSKPVKKMTKAFQENPEGALAITTVGSIVVKDGIGCYKYVTQSINNKDIPEDKRTFVASMDLTNGLLMIGTQIGMFFLMRKFSEPMFNKFFKKSFNPKIKRDILTRLRMESKKAGEIPPRKLEAEKAYSEVRSNALSLFKFIVDVGIATIIGKRIITPFIATPLAGIVESKLFKKDKEHKNADGDKLEINHYNENKKDLDDKVEDLVDEIKDELKEEIKDDLNLNKKENDDDDDD